MAFKRRILFTRARLGGDFQEGDRIAIAPDRYVTILGEPIRAESVIDPVLDPAIEVYPTFATDDGIAFHYHVSMVSASGEVLASEYVLVPDQNVRFWDLVDGPIDLNSCDPQPRSIYS